MTDTTLLETAEVAKLKVLYAANPEKLETMMGDAYENLSRCESDLADAQLAFNAAKNYYNTWHPVWERAVDEIRDASHV